MEINRLWEAESIYSVRERAREREIFNSPTPSNKNENKTHRLQKGTVCVQEMYIKSFQLGCQKNKKQTNEVIQYDVPIDLDF